MGLLELLDGMYIVPWRATVVIRECMTLPYTRMRNLTSLMSGRGAPGLGGQVGSHELRMPSCGSIMGCIDDELAHKPSASSIYTTYDAMKAQVI